MSDLREAIAKALHREFEDSSHDYEECFRPESWLNTADVVLGVVHERADKQPLDLVGVKIYPPFEDDWIDSLVDAWLHQPDFPGWESAQDITRVVLTGLCMTFGGSVVLVDPEALGGSEKP